VLFCNHSLDCRKVLCQLDKNRINNDTNKIVGEIEMPHMWKPR